MISFLRNAPAAFRVFLAAGWLLSAAPAVQGEFYQYTDDRGRRHFVDDIGRIPEQYHGQIRTHLENDDGLSPEERDARLESERNRNRDRDRRHDEWIQERIDSLRQQTEQHLSERQSRLVETPVTFESGQVLLPVQLGYGRREVTATLVLDTGASITALHRNVAESLAIRDFQKARAQVANGQVIDIDLATLDYIRVGPHLKENVRASFMDFTGKDANHNGLLGMDFLQGRPYRIDYEKGVIRWER